jgi:hypothetical protein
VQNLVVKLTLTPTLIAAVSLLGRRWGPDVSGWLVGLPFTSGPIALLLALDHGAAFAAAAAQGILAGGFSEVAYCLAYAWLARRWRWPAAFVASAAVFLLVTVSLQPVTPPLVPLFACVLASFALGLLVFPTDRQDREKYAQPRTAISPRWEIAARMALATALVLLLTGVSTALGPRLSGLLSPFPVFATILAVFTQRSVGASAAARLLRGVVYGLFAFAAFFFVLAALLERTGVLAAFLLACLAALLVQGTTYAVLKRRGRPEPLIDEAA